MKRSKQVLLVIWGACALFCAVSLLIVLTAPSWSAVFFSNETHRACKLAIAACPLVVIAGLIWYGVRSHVKRGCSNRILPIGEGVNIESGALVSTVRNAVASTSPVQIVDISVDVVPGKGERALDVRISAVPVPQTPLMCCARTIQRASKEALEVFTEHRVMRVAVDFVEPRRKPSAMQTCDVRAEEAEGRAMMYDGTHDNVPSATPRSEVAGDDGR